MLSLQTVFWIMIGFFALIGFLRGSRFNVYSGIQRVQAAEPVMSG